MNKYEDDIHDARQRRIIKGYSDIDFTVQDNSGGVTPAGCFECPYSLPVPPVDMIGRGDDWRNIKIKTY